MTDRTRVCVGEIVGAHGIRGLVRLRSYTEEPAAVVDYGSLSDETGQRRFVIRLQSAVKDGWVAHLDGVADRTTAEGLRGTRLFVERAALPEPEEDEFYHADLIGLRAERAGGVELGTVLALHDFGGGPMLEVSLPEGRTIALPFTKAVVPVVDLAGGRVVVVPPLELLEVPKPPEDGEETGL